MDKFVARENIRHFRDLLETEIDPTVRSLLHRLLIAEEDKLGHNHEMLRQIEVEIAKAKVRVERQQVLLADMQRDGHDTGRATTLLNSLSDGVVAFEDFRQMILAALRQAPGI